MIRALSTSFSFSAFKPRELRFGLVEIQLVLAVPFAQTDRLHPFRHGVDLFLFDGQLTVDAVDLLHYHVLHPGNAFEGAGFQSLRK